MRWAGSWSFIVAKAFLGVKSMPTIEELLDALYTPAIPPAYANNGPQENTYLPRAVEWITVGGHSSNNPGKFRNEVLSQGWDWYQTGRADPDIAWLQTNSYFDDPAHGTDDIQILLHNPFGTWRKIMHMDQYNHARAAAYTKLFDQSWYDWAAYPHSVKAYVGSASSNQFYVYPGGNKVDNSPNADLPFTDTNMAQFSQMVVRNLQPYYDNHMGLVVDIWSNMVITAIEAGTDGVYGTYARTQESVAWAIGMEMFGQVGVERLPRGKPPGSAAYWFHPSVVQGNDGYSEWDNYNAYHGADYGTVAGLPEVALRDLGYYPGPSYKDDVADTSGFADELCSGGTAYLNGGATGPGNDPSMGNIYILLSAGSVTDSTKAAQFEQDSRDIINNGFIPCYGYLNVVRDVPSGGNGLVDPANLTP